MRTVTAEPGGNEPSGEAAPGTEPGGFEVHLDVFEGPFDLLLGLISKHKLDITEVALSQVTDEFIAYIRALADGWDLDQASYFLLVAATLLDLKAARLLPSGEVEDEEDLALLEARDAVAQKPDSNGQPPIWETIVSLGREVPEEDWSRIPTDLAQNVDHYLYGSPKASE